MSRGHERERQVGRILKSHKWVTVRAAGSLGTIDLVAIHRSQLRPLLIECKSDVGNPFHNFGPDRRADLLCAANEALALCVLAWWPPHRPLQWIPPRDWPATEHRREYLLWSDIYTDPANLPNKLNTATVSGKTKPRS